MIKCVKGFVEIKGSKNEVAAETAILLRSLREHISEDEFKEVIENSKRLMMRLRQKPGKSRKKLLQKFLKKYCMRRINR